MWTTPPADLPPELPAPVDSATAAEPTPEDGRPHRWSLPTRIGFRFAFCYFGVYCLFNGNATVWQALPPFGESIQDALARVFSLPAQFLAGRFHVPPPGDHFHPTGSGDTAINWIAVLLMLIVSVVATAIWTGLDRNRPHYRTLSSWLRFLIRFTVGFGMAVYGIDKLFPLQMPPPSVASLAEPLGMHSPMSLLWNFIGVNPVYESICGGAELLGGLLLLFRRTALAGALFTAFVVSNVLLYNLCFDVPVKLYAGHLLVLSLFLILPDAQALFRFFWLHQAAHPTGAWVPPATRLWPRRTIVGIEIAFAVVAIGGSLFGAVNVWLDRHQERTAPCSLCGTWRIDTVPLLDASGHPIPRLLPTVKGRPAVEFDINSPTSAALVDSSGAVTYLPLKTDSASGSFLVAMPDNPSIHYAITASDPTHLTLTPWGEQARNASMLTFSLVSPPGGYPLLTRGFHWVSEYPYQR